MRRADDRRASTCQGRCTLSSPAVSVTSPSISGPVRTSPRPDSPAWPPAGHAGRRDGSTLSTTEKVAVPKGGTEISGGVLMVTAPVVWSAGERNVAAMA